MFKEVKHLDVVIFLVSHSKITLKA